MNQKLDLLVKEYASVEFDGEVVGDRNLWSDRFIKTAKNLKQPSASIVIDDKEMGYQFIAIEPYKDDNSFLILEMDNTGASIHLWMRWDEKDWEDWGPKEDGDWF